MATFRTIVVAFAMCLAANAWAQESQEPVSTPVLAVKAAKQTLVDPTTYTPAVFLYLSTRLDWDSSQVFYAHGDKEANPRFTISGRPNDTPLSYSDGNRLILMDSLRIASVSALNNVIAHFTVDAMVIRDPAHQKRWKALGWIERAAVASTLSYVLSVQHFEQWRTNERLAVQRGY